MIPPVTYQDDFYRWINRNIMLYHAVETKTIVILDPA
jgi:hypothetical protein